MSKIIESTISKIKQQGLKPEPRWKFLAKKYSIWLAFFAGLLLGAISLAVAFDWLGQLDWDIYHLSRPGVLFGLLPIIPHLWLVLMIIFLALAFFDFRKTENGYKFNFGKISLILLGGLMLLGITFYLMGIGGRFHRVVSDNVPFYKDQMMTTKINQWMRPQEGFLAGQIRTKEKESLILQDFKGRKWKIILDEKTVIMPMVKISEGEAVKMIGEKISEDEFMAEQIRPWVGKHMMMGGPMQEQRMPRNAGEEFAPMPMRR